MLGWLGTFTDNLGIKLVALILAAALYAHVVTERPVEQVLYLPVRVQGLPDSLALATDPPAEVGVRVRGTGKQILRLRVLRPPVGLELSGVAAGRFQRALTPSDFQSVSDENVEVLAAVDPTTVSLELERRVRVSLPVAVRVEGAPARGHVVSGTPTARPSEVRLSGPSGWVAGQDSLETLPVAIAGARSSVDGVVGLVPPPSWATVMPGSVLVTVPIGSEESGLRTVRPEVRGVRSGITARLDPAEVHIRWAGPQGTAGEVIEDLQVSVDLERRGRGRYLVPVRLAGAGERYVQAVEPESLAVTLH